MSALESGIARLSPTWALSRARARAAWEVMQSVKLGYDAAQVGRRAAHWRASSGSANSEVVPALSRVRNRSRDMVRNNPYARSAIQKLVARSIGTGIMARPPANVLPVWKEFVEVADFEGQHDLYGLQSLMGRTVFESGECLVQRVRGTKTSAPLQVRVLEPDYLDDLKFGSQANGNFIIAGIEITPAGQRVAYWLYDHHPGDMAQLAKTWQSRRVPASEVLHVYEKERPGQLRGMPRLATSLMRLREVDEYQDAVMMRKKIEACFAAFVSGDNTNGTLVDGKLVTTDADGRRGETLSPGMIMYGKAGEQITFGSPGGISKDEYTTDQLHAIAAGAGVTYEQMSGDYSQVTYLSARAAQLELRELVEMFRWIHFIPMGCNGIWRWFLDAYYTTGRLRTDAYPAEWTAPAFPWIDPQKDVQAAKEEVKGGLTSLSRQIRARGEDPDEVFKELAEEREKLKKLGIKVDTDAGTAVKVAAPAPDSGDGGDGGDGGAAPADRAKDAKDDKEDKEENRFAVTVNNFDRELAGPLGELAVAVRSGAETQHASGEQLQQLIASLERQQASSAERLKEQAQAMQAQAEAMLAVAKAMRDGADRQASQASELGAAIIATARSTAEGLDRLGTKLDKPSKPVLDKDGNVIGIRKVDRLED